MCFVVVEEERKPPIQLRFSSAIPPKLSSPQGMSYIRYVSPLETPSSVHRTHPSCDIRRASSHERRPMPHSVTSPYLIGWKRIHALVCMLLQIWDRFMSGDVVQRYFRLRVGYRELLKRKTLETHSRALKTR
jgi:hypothetical protein